MMICEAKYLLVLVITFAFSSSSFSVNYTKLPMHKGTLKTIYSSNGEIIDCVDFYRQPAFDHPLLKNKKHKYTPEGREFLRNMETENVDADASTFQIWRQSGEECPDGTVPILRESNYDKNVVRKMKSFARNNNSMSRSSNGGSLKNEFALVGSLGRYYGGRGVVSIWKPFVERYDEYSLAQMWLVNNKGSSTEVIEAGWHVYPKLHVKVWAEDMPRLFVYWTRDNYDESGCYNLKCPGFVQLSRKIIPGSTFYNRPSQYGGKQEIMDLQIFRDDQNKIWRLQIFDEIVGYWPFSLFSRLNDYANAVQWGGEIVNNYMPNPYVHTYTHMGSGHFPVEGYRKAAFMHTLQVIKEPLGTYVDADADAFNFLISNPNCYNLTLNSYGQPLNKVSFFFGGSGLSASCDNKNMT